MLLLILKSSACLATFMAFYKLFLEKENMHHFKRYYLLLALLVSIVIPFITFTQYNEVEYVREFVRSQPMEFSSTEITTLEISVAETPWQHYIPTFLWSIYIIGVLLFSFRFALNLKTILHKIKANPKHQYYEFTNVLLQDLVPPHTFFKYIFLNKIKYDHNLIPNEVLFHEQAHAKQKHAIDILYVEVLQIVFWFNPLLYFIKKDIKLNHEFLADQAVLQKGVDSTQYKKTLLAFSSDATEPRFTNSINYSLIKKRFTVMKTHTSKTTKWLRSLVLLPLLALLIYSFSKKEIVESEVVSAKILTIQESEKGATEAMLVEYQSFMTEFENSKIIKFDALKRASAIYDLMSDRQRSTVKKYPETELSDLSKVQPKTPTEALFNSWKNKEEFAIWIDGKAYDNTELNSYKASDFKYYTSSFVYNNARSKKFPQPYQNNLYTKKGFEEIYVKSNINIYNDLKAKYLESEQLFIFSNQKDNSELRILKAQVDQIYNSLSKADIDKYEIATIEPIQVQQTSQDITKQSNQLKAYNEKYTAYEAVRNKKPHYINRSKTEQKTLDESYISVINVFLNDLSSEERKAVMQPIPQTSPYNHITTDKNGNTIHFKSWELPDNHMKQVSYPIFLNSIKSFDGKESNLPPLSEIERNPIMGDMGCLKNDGAVFYYEVDEDKSIKLFNEKGQWLNSDGSILREALSFQEKATLEEVKEYNYLAKHYNSKLDSELPIIKVKEVKRTEYLYSKMSEDQKKNAEPYPDFSKVPPPPSPVTGFIEVNGETIYYVKFNPIRYYNKKGYLVDKNGKTVNGNKQVNASDVLPGQYITKVYQNNKVVVEFKDNLPENAPPLPPSPPNNTSKVLETNTNKNIVLLGDWYITLDNKKYYYPYIKGDLKKYYDQYGNEVAIDIVKEYKKKYDLFEKLKNEGKHYVHKTENNKKEIDHLYSDLGGMFFRMTKENKTKVKRPENPNYPYIILIKNNGEVYYKKKSELTEEDIKLIPPPPPPPPAPPSKKN